MRLEKILSLVMIYLIISITFISSIALADIYQAGAQGKDGVPGIIRSTDTLVVNSSSTMPCSVDYRGNESFVQMNCGSGLPINCAYTAPITNVAGRLNITIKESGSELRKDVSVYVDTVAPVITQLSASSLGGTAEAYYTIKDSTSTFYPGKCSGIKKVELLLNGKVVSNTIHPIGVCEVTGSIKGFIKDYIGNVNVSLYAYDYVDLKANQTSNTVFLESKAPRIGTAKVYRIGTKDAVTKISLNGTKAQIVDVEIAIDEESLSASGATGDFTQLSKNNGAGQSSIPGTCTETEEGKYTCLFKSLNLLPASTTPTINITATDEAGNIATKGIKLSFTNVNSAGTVSRLGPDASHCNQDKCYLKSGGNEIIALISTSSSYNDSDVEIEGVKASCIYNSTWKCAAIVDSPGTTLHIEGYDDLGNKLSADSKLQIIIDSDAPVRTSPINVTPKCARSTESLNIKFNVTEAVGPTLKIRADTASVSSNNETITSCTKVGTTNTWKCALSISKLLEEEINTNLNVIVEDFAGNKLTESVPVSVCVEIAEAPDLIEKINTRGTLPKIDKKVASKITVKAAIGLQIKLRADDVEIIQRSTVDCSKTPGIAGSAYMLIDNTLKPTLIIPLKYKEQWDEDGAVKVSCVQEFKIKQGNRIYVTPESENITAELETYNQPLGSVDDNLKKKITEIKTNIKKLDRQITKREKVDNILGTVCKYAEGLGAINSLLQSAKSVLYGVAMFLNAVPILGSAAGQTLWSFTQTALGGVQNFVDSFIWPQGWIPTGGNTIGLLVKGTCAIYTCKFYDMNTFVDIGMSIGAAYATKNDVQYTVDEKTGEMTGYDPKTGDTTFRDKSGALTKSIAGDGTIIMYTNGVPDKIYVPQGTMNMPGPGGVTIPVVIYTDGTGNSYALNQETGELITLPQTSSPSAAEPAAVEAATEPTFESDIEFSLVSDYPLHDSNGNYKVDANGNKIYANGNVVHPWDPGYSDSSTGTGAGSSAASKTEGGKTADANSGASGASPGTGQGDSGGTVEPPSPQNTPTSAQPPTPQSMPAADTAQSALDQDIAYLASQQKIISNDPADAFKAGANSKYFVFPDDSDSTKTVIIFKNGPDWMHITYDKQGNLLSRKSYNRFWGVRSGIAGLGDRLHETFMRNIPSKSELIEMVTIGGAVFGGSAFSALRLSNAMAAAGKGTNEFTRSIYYTINAARSRGIGYVIASDSITGKATSTPDSSKSIIKPFTSTGYNDFDLNYRLGSAVDAFLGDDGSWIFNPYKSKHYDSLCSPATLFNDRKERQLLCKRLGCIENMVEIGGPIEACDFDYSLDMCMYVESARSKIKGGSNLFSAIGKALFSNILGTAVVASYMFIWPGCVHYQVPGGATIDQVLVINGWRSAACGVTGSLLSARELIAFIKNPYNPLEGKAPVDPVEQADGMDFCSGVDY